MTEYWNDGERDEPIAVAIDDIPSPVVGYEIVDGIPKITVGNNTFDTIFETASNRATIREWLLQNGAVDESTVEHVCSSLVCENAIDAEIGIGTVNGSGTKRRSVRLRSFCQSDDSDSIAGVDEVDAVDGYLLVTELAPTSVDNTERGGVASVITHDLRNPLDIANAHLRAARETGDEDHFDEVKDAHDRMERIIQDALTLARGERALDVAENVAIEDIATDAWTTVETGTATLDLDESLSTIDADDDRLQRLFENLFRNVVEHAHPEATEADEGDRDGAVSVRVGRVDDGFFVGDDGPGIPADKRAKVFEPGYSATETGSGTGLGLTIVERIARAHDWTIAVSEGPRGGAKFEFRQLIDDD